MNQEVRQFGRSAGLVAAGVAVGWVAAESGKNERLLLSETPPAIRLSLIHI